MLKNTLAFILLVMPLFSQAQCKDTTLVDPYHYCGLPYQPVCGCDNITYRNYCAAQYWGGILNPGSLLAGNICPNENFDFDFVPNPINEFSGGNSDSHLHIFVNTNLFSQLGGSVPYSVYLLDIFNKVMYQRDAIASPEDNVTSGDDFGIPIADFSSDYFGRFENGIYILIITVNGEQKTKKIVVENPK